MIRKFAPLQEARPDIKVRATAFYFSLLLVIGLLALKDVAGNIAQNVRSLGRFYDFTRTVVANPNSTTEISALKINR